MGWHKVKDRIRVSVRVSVRVKLGWPRLVIDGVDCVGADTCNAVHLKSRVLVYFF